MFLDFELDNSVVLAQHLQVDVLGFARFWVLTNETKKMVADINFQFHCLETIVKFTKILFYAVKYTKTCWKLKIKLEFFSVYRNVFQRMELQDFLLYFTTKWRLLTWRGCLRANVKLYNLTYTQYTAYRLFTNGKFSMKFIKLFTGLL